MFWKCQTSELASPAGISENVVAVTSLFTAFGKQTRFSTLGENQCRIHTMQATVKEAKASNGVIAVQLITVHRTHSGAANIRYI